MNNNIPGTNFVPQFNPTQSTAPPITNFSTLVPSTVTSQEYIFQLLKDNPNRFARVFMSFPDSVQWRDRIFEGTIVNSGKDYVIIKSRGQNEWYVLWTIYINFIEFTEDIYIN